ncbi:RDD family protein [Saccharomonospora iraqiensis]|uniref:RDD family protein n=1 Tax=Saccharomonospora iraqiensis TaxID=52698 RepID=UPI001F37CF23|nr:RDD family protein [Saccharomonospora iraqiensis]
MPGSQIQFAHSGPLVLGTMGSRFLARLVDGLIIGLPLGTLFLIVQFALLGPEEWWVTLIFYPIMAAAMLVYEGVMLSSRGATVGKSVAGLKLVTEQSVTTAGGPGSGPAFTRMATMFLPGLIPCIGGLVSILMILSPFFDEQARQGWHDKAAKTYVISTKPMPMY